MAKPSRCLTRCRTTIWACLFFVWGTSARGQRIDAAEPAPEALRARDPALTKMIAEGLAASPTLRRLEAQLRAGHVIVYLLRDFRMSDGVIGRTRLLTATGRWRYLAIDLDYKLMQIDLLSTLGHELQHAVEIADAPDVIDSASLERLYRRIGIDEGRAFGRESWFETREARLVGERVHKELGR